MKKFSKELFLQTVELEKEKGIITQQDIDNALVVWVNDAEGRTKEELKDMSIEIKSLKEDWLEGESEEEIDKDFLEDTVIVILDEPETPELWEEGYIYAPEFSKEEIIVPEKEEEIVPIKEEILPLIESELSKEEYETVYFEEIKPVDSKPEIIEGIPVDETPLEEILGIEKDIVAEEPTLEEKEEEIMVEEKKITKDNSLIKEEEIEN